VPRIVVTPVLAPIASVARKIQRKFGMRSASCTSRSGSSRSSLRFAFGTGSCGIRRHVLPQLTITASVAAIADAHAYVT
jgi:hypothetical protein